MVLLDSNIWIALLYEKDPNHEEASDFFSELNENIIVTEYIILEVATIISQKKNKQAADAFLENISNNQDIELWPSSKEFLGEVVNFYLSQKSARLSFVDYSLLYLSQRIKVVTFDKKLKKEIENIN